MTTPFHRPRMAFRAWRRSRPFWAGVWSVLGGVLVASGPLLSIKLIMIAGQTVWLGALVGILIVVCGIFLWFEVNLVRLIGALVVILAVISLITSDLGGFLIGMLLAIIGGAMAVAWTPNALPDSRATVSAKGDASVAPQPNASVATPPS